MDKVKYKEIIKNGERVEWYGIKVPKELLSNLVITWATSLKKEIDSLESTLLDLNGSSLEKRKGYIKGLISNIQNAPYSLNDDVYLKKKDEIELEMENETKKSKIKKNKKTTIKSKSSSKTKNSDLIFGKNKK